jgi:hypothetical protein
MVLLMAILIVSSLLLVQAQGMMIAGAEVLVVGVADCGAIVAIHLLHPLYRRPLEDMEDSLGGHLVWCMVLG